MTETRWPERARQAVAAIEDFMAALNARDDAALYDLLHLPHVRVSGAGVAIWHDRVELEATYLRDFYARAGPDWHHTILDSTEVIHSSEHKGTRADPVHEVRRDRRGHRHLSFAVDNDLHGWALGSAGAVEFCAVRVDGVTGLR